MLAAAVAAGVAGGKQKGTRRELQHGRQGADLDIQGSIG